MLYPVGCQVTYCSKVSGECTSVTKTVDRMLDAVKAAGGHEIIVDTHFPMLHLTSYEREKAHKRNIEIVKRILGESKYICIDIHQSYIFGPSSWILRKKAI